MGSTHARRPTPHFFFAACIASARRLLTSPDTIIRSSHAGTCTSHRGCNIFWMPPDCRRCSSLHGAVGGGSFLWRWYPGGDASCEGEEVLGLPMIEMDLGLSWGPRPKYAKEMKSWACPWCIGFGFKLEHQAQVGGVDGAQSCFYEWTSAWAYGVGLWERWNPKPFQNLIIIIVIIILNLVIIIINSTFKILLLLLLLLIQLLKYYSYYCC